MRTASWIVATSLFIAGCGGADQAPTNESAPSAADPQNQAVAATPSAGGVEAQARWSLQRDAGQVALALAPASGDHRIRLRCTMQAPLLTVDVPSFRSIGSEERLSFGSGAEVVALVAAIKEHGQSGVSAAGDVPANLAALIGGPISASYGAQKSGPHGPPPPDLARDFLAACGKKAAPATTPTPPGPAAGAAPGACMMQGKEKLRLAAVRAVGTEPFWGARIEGRCVTYNHPEDQKGTRVWTRYSPAPDGGTWSGALGGSKFELRTRRRPGCSDGMSDKKYPIAVELLVGGEKRTGCAEPL